MEETNEVAFAAIPFVANENAKKIIKEGTIEYSKEGQVLIESINYEPISILNLSFSFKEEKLGSIDVQHVIDDDDDLDEIKAYLREELLHIIVAYEEYKLTSNKLEESNK